MSWENEKSEDYLKLVREISSVLNKISIDNDLETPDFILAQGVVGYLQSLLRMKLNKNAIEFVSDIKPVLEEQHEFKQVAGKVGYPFSDNS